MKTKISQISHCGLVPILTGTPPWSTRGEDIMPISSKFDTLKKNKKLLHNLVQFSLLNDLSNFTQWHSKSKCIGWIS